MASQVCTFFRRVWSHSATSMRSGLLFFCLSTLSRPFRPSLYTVDELNLHTHLVPEYCIGHCPVGTLGKTHSPKIPLHRPPLTSVLTVLTVYVESVDSIESGSLFEWRCVWSFGVPQGYTTLPIQFAGGGSYSCCSFDLVCSPGTGNELSLTKPIAEFY
jgi:hypothetical protein